MLCYLNGQFVSRATASVPVEDRGFIFGDGIYEVWRVINGRLFELERHLDRLNFGLSELRITPPEVAHLDGLMTVADRLLRENELLAGEATVYLEITRGVAPRAHQFPAASTAPSVFMMTNRFTPPEELRSRGAAAITGADIRWLRCDIKTIQLLPNVMAKQSAVERGATECIMIRDGFVTEGSHANVLAVVDGVLRTHPLSNLILPGITRAVILDLARSLGVPVREEAMSAAELARVEEIFLAGTTTDVMPIVKLDDRVVGSGKPGSITTRLHREFRAYLDAACAPVGAAR